jgi:hypothetical protein
MRATAERYLKKKIILWHDFMPTLWFISLPLLRTWTVSAGNCWAVFEPENHFIAWLRTNRLIHNHTIAAYFNGECWAVVGGVCQTLSRHTIPSDFQSIPTMPLEHINWNNLYSKRLKNRKFVKERVEAHYRILSLEGRGVVKASMRYVSS